jgi:hypothetical protein
MTAKTLARKINAAARTTDIAHPRTGKNVRQAFEANGFIGLVDTYGHETFATREQVAAMLAAAR